MCDRQRNLKSKRHAINGKARMKGRKKDNVWVWKLYDSDMNGKHTDMCLYNPKLVKRGECETVTLSLVSVWVVH